MTLDNYKRQFYNRMLTIENQFNRVMNILLD